MAISKNLGQVAAIYIGTSAPSNHTLVWYDSTPSVKKHKVYDTNLGSWVILNPNSFTSVTYSNLRSLATGSGLTQLSWYKITDKGNCLALAITSTKVQYVDGNNNFIIDDLASSAVYVVNSSNLYIDDLGGVWDSTNNRLKFNFTAVNTQTATSGNDYLFGKRSSGGVTSFVKHKISGLISAVTGNSLSWNSGIYFNFVTSLHSMYDVENGVASKNYVDTQISLVNASIGNLSDAITSSYNNAIAAINTATSDSSIFGKQLPSAPTGGTAVDISQYDTLLNIVNKVQRWITQFKVADGIKVTGNFEEYTSKIPVAPNDTVDVALRKLQKYASSSTTATGINVSANFQPYPSYSYIFPNDSIDVALRKLQYIVEKHFEDIGDLNTEINKNIQYGVARIHLKLVSGNDVEVGFCMGLCISTGRYQLYQDYTEYYATQSSIKGEILAFQSPMSVYKKDIIAGVVSTKTYSVYSPLKRRSGAMYIQVPMQFNLYRPNGNEVVERYLTISSITGTAFGANISSYIGAYEDRQQIDLSENSLLNFTLNIPSNAMADNDPNINITLNAYLE
jgi:ribosomal protein S21